MKFFSKLRQILAMRVPNWLGRLCYALLVITILLLIFVCSFPEWVGSFVAEHDIKLFQ
jgi:hypothetical protein